MTAAPPSSGPEVMVTLCLLFEGMTVEGHPILRDRLNDRLFVLKPYDGDLVRGQPAPEGAPRARGVKP